MKKFYKVNERVWIKALKRTGIVQEVMKDTLEAKVLVTKLSDQEESFTQVMKLWEIDKYQKPEKILVKYFDETLPKLEAIKVGNWIDLRASEEVILNQFEYRLIPLGVAMQLPKGYEAHILPRSSTYKNFGIILANSKGIVDNSYCGNEDMWYFPAIALRNTVINKGDRICQFRITKVMGRVNFIEVQELDNENRGGIGSTGTN